VFVSSSQGDDATADGTKKKPYKTLAAGIGAAAKASKPVYACAETFSEALSVNDGVGLYGGLDCKGSWGYAGDVKSTLTTDADSVPLTLNKGANGAALFDFKVVAVDAVIAGGSSIAVIANQATAAFTRCDLVAENGAAGTPGVMSTDSVGPTIPTASEIRGNDGANACASMTKSFGGGSKDNALCPSANGGPFGGDGGFGAIMTAGDGLVSLATPQTALGGTGQTADPSWDCSMGAGHIGVKGLSGADGAKAKDLGTIDSSGYSGVAGGDADVGKPGQGGGGGGGAKGKTSCAGASGGGGGVGGCGGHGGTGGRAGGASIAVVSLGATLSFNDVTVALGTGGGGGDGGDGQPGGAGGAGGSGGLGNGTAVLACNGGGGGTGGTGGKGGGGRGGHAIGIAASGKTVPDTTGVTFSQQGKAGLGGKGGPAQDGDPGVRADVQMFP
jgi:hypothetical protein